jgi:hypothetical protein
LTGVDENSEWNRYQLVVDELVSLGLSEEIKKIDSYNNEKVDLIWKKLQQQ